MTTQHSYADARAGQQLYAVLTQCRRPQALWDKLATGRYDWLGVRSNGRYVLGQPRLTPLTSRDPVLHRAPGADGQHRVEYRGPLDRGANQEWYVSQGDARDGYDRVLADDPGSAIPSSGVWLVRLYVRGVLAGEELLVRRLPKLL